jgi:hypothetical protein
MLPTAMRHHPVYAVMRDIGCFEVDKLDAVGEEQKLPLATATTTGSRTLRGNSRVVKRRGRGRRWELTIKDEAAAEAKAVKAKATADAKTAKAVKAKATADAKTAKAVKAKAIADVKGQVKADKTKAKADKAEAKLAKRNAKEMY